MFKLHSVQLLCFFWLRDKNVRYRGKTNKTTFTTFFCSFKHVENRGPIFWRNGSSLFPEIFFVRQEKSKKKALIWPCGRTVTLWIILSVFKSTDCFLAELFIFSVNLLVVYHESVNLIGYLTRRLSVVSKIQLVVYYQYCVLIGWATSRLFVIAH